VEIAATVRVLFLLINITEGLAVEDVVAVNRDPPKNEGMDGDEYDPVKEELSLLLGCDLGFSFVNLKFVTQRAIHFLKEHLLSVTLHVHVRCFHRLE